MSSSYPPFAQYREEFSNLVKRIEQCLHNEEDASDLVSQCESLLPQMYIEARGAPRKALKQELMDVHNACKMQCQSYKTLNEKMELMSTKSNVARMHSSKDLAIQQNSRLEGALRSIRESEEVASEIRQELSRNRETLENTQNNIGKLSTMTEQADGLVTSMMKRWF